MKKIIQTGNNQIITIIFFFFFSSQVFAASPYALKIKNEFFYLSAGTALSLAGYYNEKNRAAPTATNLNALDKNNIPFFERGFAGTWNKNSQQLSNITLAAGMLSPASLLFIEGGDKNDYFTLGVMYLETFALTNGGVTFSKGSAPRYRPFAYGDSAPLSEKLNIDTTRSFFSGHAALAASGFIFSASVFSDYFPQSKYKSIVWATAITGSVATGLLRISGGKHFPSDVAVGLAWGAAVGYLIPALHKKERGFSLIPFTNGRQQGIRFIKPL